MCRRLMHIYNLLPVLFAKVMVALTLIMAKTEYYNFQKFLLLFILIIFTNK